MPGNKLLASDWRLTTGIGAVFFVLTSIFSGRNEICCMFSACRSYGFPGTFLSLCKTTDSFQEAQLINHSSALDLLRQGWHPAFTSRMNDFFPSATINLLLDFALAVLVSWLFLKLISLASKMK
ncbi:MAG: hypothetical protein WC551_04380 [Patescibacteria group bacterium]